MNRDRLNLNPPSLVLLMGVAGTGKTTLARSLLTRVWAVYLDNNFVVDSFFPNTRIAAPYLELRDKLYSVLYRITSENLQAGNTVLLDAPHVKEMLNPQWASWLSEFVSANHAALRIIRCFTSEKILRNRIQSRAEPRDNWKLQNWEEFIETQPILHPLPFPHLDLDTSTEGTEAQTTRAMEYLLSDMKLSRNLE